MVSVYSLRTSTSQTSFGGASRIKRMNEGWPSTLLESDPLHIFLVDEIFTKQLGYPRYPFHFNVELCKKDGSVVRCVDSSRFVSVVVKYYGKKWIHGNQSGEAELRAKLMQAEFEKLSRARALGLQSLPHRVVRPLATCQGLDFALVEDYAPGDDLDFFIRRAIHDNRAEELLDRLTDVVWFLADLHDRSAIACSTQDDPVDYLAGLADQLLNWRLVSPSEYDDLIVLGNRWRESGVLKPPRVVLVHGDATPTQFRFAGNHDLTVIDFERLRCADAAADLGRLAADLKHMFYWLTGDRWAGERFIRHLYEAYLRYVIKGTEDLESLTGRGRFYMGCDELRISRNHWLDFRHRRNLVEEAKACLAI